MRPTTECLPMPNLLAPLSEEEEEDSGRPVELDDVVGDGNEDVALSVGLDVAEVADVADGVAGPGVGDTLGVVVSCSPLPSFNIGEAGGPYPGRRCSRWTCPRRRGRGSRAWWRDSALPRSRSAQRTRSCNADEVGCKGRLGIGEPLGLGECEESESPRSPTRQLRRIPHHHLRLPAPTRRPTQPRQPQPQH